MYLNPAELAIASRVKLASPSETVAIRGRDGQPAAWQHAPSTAEGRERRENKHSYWLKDSGEGHVREWLRKKNRDLLLKKRSKKRAERREREKREREARRKEKRTAQAKEVYVKWQLKKADEGREKRRKEREEKQKEQAQDSTVSFSTSFASKKNGARHQPSIRRNSPNLPHPVKKISQEGRIEVGREGKVCQMRGDRKEREERETETKRREGMKEGERERREKQTSKEGKRRTEREKGRK